LNNDHSRGLQTWFFVYHCTLALRNASLDISNIQQHDVVAVMLQCCIL